MDFFYNLNKRLNGIRELPATTHGQLNESKPDFLDLDQDGDTKEPMKKAAADKKAAQKPDYKSKLQDKFGGSAADLTRGLSIKGKKVDEGDVEEGNEFAGELSKARAAGAKEFKVGDKTYPVKEGTGMSRAAKGMEKYGKQGMQALAKAGREGKSLDPVRAKFNKYDESMAEAATPASTSKILRLIQRHHSDWFDTYGIGEVEDAVVDMAKMGQFQGMSAENAVALVAQELDSLYGSQGMAEGNHTKDAMELNPDFARVGRKPGIMGKMAQGVKRVADKIMPGDEDLLRDLERKTGGRRPTKEAAAPIDFDKVLDAIAALYGDDIWENDAMQDLANDLEQAGPTDRELDFIIAKGKLPKRLANTQFSAGDNVRFGEAAAPMSAKQKSFAALAPPKNKITFADKIAGAKKEVDEMLGDVAAEAMKSALGKQQVRGMGEATKEVPGGRRHTAEPGGYGRKDDEDAPRVKTQRGRGRPKTGADSETGQVMKPDFSAFGVGGKVNLPKHKGAVTKHKMVGEAVSDDDIEVLERLMDQAFTEGNKALGNALQDALERIQGDQDEGQYDDEEQVNEKAVSKKQQRFMGMVSAAKKGDKPASKEVARVAKTMKKGDADDFASTKHKGLPDKAKAKDTDKKPAKQAKEDKVDETTTSGSVAAAPAAGSKKSSGGITFGQGVYEAKMTESYDRRLKAMMNESMSINTSMNSVGEHGQGKSLTITATDEDAEALSNILKMAGLFSSSGYTQVQRDGSSSCGEQVEEELANSAGNTAYADTDTMVNKLSGGLNGPKLQVNPNNPGDNPLAMTGLGQKPSPALNLGRMAENVELAAQKSLWNLYKGIK